MAEESRQLDSSDLLLVQNQQLRYEIVLRDVSLVDQQQTILQYKKSELEVLEKDLVRRKDSLKTLLQSLETERSKLLQDISTKLGIQNSGDWALDVNTGVLTKKG
jgi:hypothetical protein